MKKNQNGITLIALVITIIVLLILAGVSIAMLTGENGILSKATSAKDESSKAEVKEAVSLAIAEIYANKNDTVSANNGVKDVTAANIASIATKNNSAIKLKTGTAQDTAATETTAAKHELTLEFRDVYYDVVFTESITKTTTTGETTTTETTPSSLTVEVSATQK